MTQIFLPTVDPNEGINNFGDPSYEVTPSRTIELENAKVLVAGLGATGHAVVNALKSFGATVITVADSDEADYPMPSSGPKLGCGTGATAYARELLTEAPGVGRVDFVVTSPGIPPTNYLLRKAKEEGIPVFSEVELAWQLRGAHGGTPAKWLCVTGTNGKTTTVGMLESILNTAGENARAVGNIGPSLIEAVLDPTLTVLAVELSSFQLHYTHTMSAEAAAVLNIAPDHLDWHGGLENYANDKGKIFHNVHVAGIYNVADPLTEQLIADAEVVEGARAVGFTLGIPQRGMVGVVDDALVDRAFHMGFGEAHREKHADELATFADLAHLGSSDKPAPHIVANALAAAVLARAHGVPRESIAAGLRAYQPGAHRIQNIAEIDGVTYVDDSKATNAHAAAASLQAFPPGTVVWIAGGLAKGATFDDLVKENRGALKAAVVIGVDQAPIMEALGRHAADLPVLAINPEETEIMQSAVAAAQQFAEPGDTVLLAPAGASMDQFRSYAHRGEAFAEAVNALAGAASANE